MLNWEILLIGVFLPKDLAWPDIVQELRGGFHMNTDQLVSNRVTRLLWRPVQKAAQFIRQVGEAAQQVLRQLQETAQLMLRALDGATLQATRIRGRSQVEFMFGPLTFSVASGVIYARPDGDFPA